jgi:hypothetical protein
MSRLSRALSLYHKWRPLSFRIQNKLWNWFNLYAYMVSVFGICTIMRRNWDVLWVGVLVSRNVAAKFRVRSQASPCRIFGSQRYWYRLCYECVGVPLSSLLHRRWVLTHSPIHYRRYIIQWGMLQRTMLQRSNATVVPPVIAWLLFNLCLGRHCNEEDEGSVISLLSEFEYPVDCHQVDFKVCKVIEIY